ncbi:hypothetical protein ACTXT7_010231 [Hymenolepis weldensis]
MYGLDLKLNHFSSKRNYRDGKINHFINPLDESSEDPRCEVMQEPENAVRYAYEFQSGQNDESKIQLSDFIPYLNSTPLPSLLGTY